MNALRRHLRFEGATRRVQGASRRFDALREGVRVVYDRASSTRLGRPLRRWLDLVKDTDAPMRSAAVAFYLLVSVAPLLVSAAAFTAAFQSVLEVSPEELVGGLLTRITEAAPFDLSGTGFEQQLIDLASRPRALGLGSFLATLLAGSRVLRVLQSTLGEAAHGGQSPRGSLMERAMASLSVIAVLLVVLTARLVAGFVLNVGNVLGTALLQRDMRELLEGIVLPAVDLGLVVAAFVVVAQLGSTKRHGLWALFVGGGAFVAGALLMNAGYGLYLRWVADLDALYGGLATVAAVLLWVYFASLCAVLALLLTEAITEVRAERAERAATSSLVASR